MCDDYIQFTCNVLYLMNYVMYLCCIWAYGFSYNKELKLKIDVIVRKRNMYQSILTLFEITTGPQLLQTASSFANQVQLSRFKLHLILIQQTFQQLYISHCIQIKNTCIHSRDNKCKLISYNPQELGIDRNVIRHHMLGHFVSDPARVASLEMYTEYTTTFKAQHMVKSKHQRR